jgi:hypothetical protein
MGMAIKSPEVPEQAFDLVVKAYALCPVRRKPR